MKPQGCKVEWPYQDVPSATSELKPVVFQVQSFDSPCGTTDPAQYKRGLKHFMQSRVPILKSEEVFKEKRSLLI